MSIYNKNYKLVNPGTYGHDGKPSLFSEDTSGKRRHFIRFVTKLDGLVSFDPVHGRSGYSLDTLGYLTIWGDHMYYRNNKVLPGKYSPLTGFQLEKGGWIDYGKMNENVEDVVNNYMFTAPYMFDTIYKWDNNKKYGEGSKLIYKGNSLENYLNPYNAKITTNIDESRSLRDTIFKDKTSSPFGDVTVINSLGSYFGGNGAVKYSNGYSWNMPMPLKLSITANTTEQRWIMRLSEDKKYIRAVNLAYFPFIMIEGRMEFFANGEMLIGSDTKLYHRKTRKLLAFNGHTYKNKPFEIIPDKRFDAAFLFHSFAYDENGRRTNTIYNYLDYTVKAQMAGKDGEFDLTREDGLGFLPIYKSFHVYYHKEDSKPENRRAFIGDGIIHKQLTEDMDKLISFGIGYTKMPGLFYTNTTYDIKREQNYLPWRKIQGTTPHHALYPDNKNSLPLVIENLPLKQNGPSAFNPRFAWHESTHHLLSFFNVTTNYLQLADLDCYLKQEPGLNGRGYTAYGGNLVGGFKDYSNGVTLGYYSDVSEADKIKYDLKNAYSTRRRGDELNSDTTYIRDHRGDLPYYTEEEYKADIMKGIGAQKMSLPDSYLSYETNVLKPSAGFNDFKPIIPGKGGVIRAATNGDKKATVSGDVLVYIRPRLAFYFLDEGTELDIVELPDGRNYYNVNNLSGKTSRRVSNMHLKLNRLLKRQMVPLRALNNTDPPKPKSYLGNYLCNQDFSTYVWDNTSLRSIAVEDLFVSTIQYIEWLPKRFPFKLVSANQVQIRANHPFRVVQQNCEMIIQSKVDYWLSFPIDLGQLHRGENYEFLDKMPVYSDEENADIDNRHFEDLRRDGKPFWDYDLQRWVIYGLLPSSNPLPERVSYAATEILNFPSLKSLGINTKDKLQNIAKLRWNNDYPGYYCEFPGGNVMVTKGTKRGWYHYYGTTDRNNKNKSDDIYTYLFSEPIPQREVVSATGRALDWSENDLNELIYHRGPRYNDMLDNLEETLVDVKYKDIYYTVGGRDNAGMINSKRRYKVVAAFGTGDHLNDEVVSTHYWDHSVNLTGETYNLYVNKDETRFNNFSACDRMADVSCALLMYTDNATTYPHYNINTMGNTWLKFEVDGETVYTGNISDFYAKDYVVDDYYINEFNTKAICYYIQNKRFVHFDLDGRTVVFANYAFAGDPTKPFIRDTPLFYYKDEATGDDPKFVIPEKYKHIQEKIDNGVPLKVYFYHHPDPEWYKNPTPVYNNGTFKSQNVFDFTKPPKLIGNTTYIPNRLSYTLDDDKGIIVNFENAISTINNWQKSQYEFLVESEVFNTRLDDYERKHVYSREFAELSKHAKNSNGFYDITVNVDVLKTAMRNGVGSAYFEDGRVLKLNASSANISEAEYNKLKAKKDPNILKVKITITTRYTNVYVYGYRMTTPYTVTLYFKNYQKLLPTQV